MNKYDAKIIKIIEESGINQFEYKNVFEEVNKVINNVIGINDKVGIWGYGIHTEELFKNTDILKYNVAYIIDRKFDFIEETERAFSFVGPKKLNGLGINKIIISSFSYKEEIKEEIKKKKISVDVIDIYEELEKNGVFLDDVFYINDVELGGFKEYKKINRLYMDYKKTKNEKYLEGLILEYIEIRDFIYAFKFIDEYIEKGYRKKVIMKLIKVRLKEIFVQLQLDIKKNTKINTYLFFIDSLKACDVYLEDYCEWTKEFAFSNTFLTKAYSNSLYTYESFLSAILNKLPLEKECFKRTIVDEREVSFIQYAKKRGMNIIYTLQRADLMMNINNQECVYDGGRCITKDIWNCVTNFQGDRENLGFIYTMSETHTPFMCGYHNHEMKSLGKIIGFEEMDSDNIMKRQFIDGLKYMDEQMKFYVENLCKDSDNIMIFSDHGNMGADYNNSIENIGDKFTWHEDRIRIPIIIKSKYFDKGEVKEIFQLKDICKLIENIIEGNNTIPKRDFAQVQISRINNPVWRAVFSNYPWYVNSFECFVDKNYKYIYCSNGEEFLYEIKGFEDISIDDTDILTVCREKYKLNKML